MYNKKRYMLAICIIAATLIVGIFYVDQGSSESVATDEITTATTLNGGDSVQLTYSGETTLTISGTNTISISALNSSSFYSGIYCSGGNLTINGDSNSSGNILNIIVSSGLNTTYLSNTFGITVAHGNLTINNCTVNIFVDGGSVGNRAIYICYGDTNITSSILNIAGSEKAIRTGVTGDDLTITDSSITATSGTGNNSSGTDDSVTIKAAGHITVVNSIMQLNTSAVSTEANVGGVLAAGSTSSTSGGAISVNGVSLTGNTYTDTQSVTYNCINVPTLAASRFGDSYVLCSEVSNQFELDQALNSGVGEVKLIQNIVLSTSLSLIINSTTCTCGAYVCNNIAVILDLNGHTISTDSSSTPHNCICVENGGNLTVIDSGVGVNGSISCGNSTGNVIITYGILTLQKCIITSTAYGIYVASSGSLTSGSEVSITSYYNAIGGNGTQTGANITISGGTYTSDTTAVVYFPSTTSLIVTGGTFTGKTGFDIRAGNVSISNATIEINQTENIDVTGTSGPSSWGMGIAIFDLNGYSDFQNAINVTVSNTTIVGATYDIYSGEFKLNGSGGTFDTTALAETYTADHSVKIIVNGTTVFSSTKGNASYSCVYDNASNEFLVYSYTELKNSLAVQNSIVRVVANITLNESIKVCSGSTLFVSDACTLTTGVNVSSGILLEINGGTLASNSNGIVNGLVDVTGSGSVISNIYINNTVAEGRGILVTANTGTITISDVKINDASRYGDTDVTYGDHCCGIRVEPSGTGVGLVVNITDSSINSKYALYVYNAAGTGTSDSEHATVNITHSNLSGYCAIYLVLSNYTIINTNVNTTLEGIQASSGSGNGFGVIDIQGSKNCLVNINGAVQSKTTISALATMDSILFYTRDITASESITTENCSVNFINATVSMDSNTRSVGSKLLQIETEMAGNTVFITGNTTFNNVNIGDDKPYVAIYLTQYSGIQWIVDGSSASGTLYFEYGTTHTITAQTKNGYTGDAQISLSGATLNGSSFTVAYSAVTVTETGISRAVTLTVSASEGGTVTGSGTYAYGTHVTVLAVPTDGYKFVSWSDGGTQTHTVIVTSDMVLTAMFGEVAGTTYTISVSHNGNGTVTGNTAVTSGDSSVFTIIANTGNKVSDVIVDGSSVGAVGYYIFKNVTSDHTISVIFERSEGTTTTVSDDGDVTETTEVSDTDGTSGSVSRTTTSEGDVHVAIALESSDGTVTTTAVNSSEGSSIQTTVSVESTVLGNTSEASVDDLEMAEALKQEQLAVSSIGDDATITVMISVASDSSSSITDVTVSQDSLIDLNEAGACLEISTGTGMVLMDNSVLSNLESDSLTVSIGKVDTASLTEAQQKAAGNMTVIEASARSGDSSVHELGGMATISVSYELKSGENPDNIQILYLKDDGTTETYSAVYDSVAGTVSFQTDHFSYYAITFESSDNSNSVLYIVAVVIIAIAAVVMIYWYMHIRKTE